MISAYNLNVYLVNYLERKKLVNFLKMFFDEILRFLNEITVKITKM